MNRAELKKHIIWGAFCLTLLTLATSLYFSYSLLSEERAKLQSQLTDLRDKEKRSSVVRHISEQMEDIAYQQKEISDKQREEAVMQTRIANEMRNRAEAERIKAQEAEKQAVSAFNLAEEQRTLAEVKQQQAEYSKRVADTLSYIALGRSLGSLATTQHQAGNLDLAALMAYSAWLYTTRYEGDIYQPAIFQALTVCSASATTWSGYKGGISRIVPYADTKETFITVSKYGEIVRWKRTGNRLDDRLLFSNADYDFRDAFIDSGHTLYALSYNGSVVILSDNGTLRTVPLEGKRFMRVFPFDSDHLLLVAERSLCFFSKKEMRPHRTIPLAQPVSAAGLRGRECILLGQGGFASRVTSDGKVIFDPLLTKEKVTAYTWSPQLNMAAIGCESGTIYLLSAEGDVLQRLIKHHSSITQLEFNGDHLLSSGYDRILNLWDFQGKKEITVRTAAAWIHCFAFLEEGTVWTGDENATLSRIVISPDIMAQQIRNGLKRDFTEDEWNYYIGENIPYESFKK